MSKHLHIPGSIAFCSKGDGCDVTCLVCGRTEYVATWIKPLKGWRKAGWGALQQTIGDFLALIQAPKFQVMVTPWDLDQREYRVFLKATNLRAARTEAKSFVHKTIHSVSLQKVDSVSLQRVDPSTLKFKQHIQTF